MNVLVTGAAGFIGSTLVDALLARGDRVVAVDDFNPQYPAALKRHNVAAAVQHPNYSLYELSVVDRKGISALVSRAKPDIVVHLAALLNNRTGNSASGSFYETNVTGTQALLDACMQADTERFILVSTSTVYGDSVASPFKQQSSNP